MSNLTQQTNNRGYPSKYSPDSFVTAHQYIAELLCERKAVSQNITLPIRFWRLPEWGKFFRYQSVCVATLLKNYDAKAIIQALNKANKTWSLRNKYFQFVLKEEQRKINLASQHKIEQEIIRPVKNNIDNIRTNMQKWKSKDAISILQDLEDATKEKNRNK